jgi:hypothetical protein
MFSVVGRILMKMFETFGQTEEERKETDPRLYNK